MGACSNLARYESRVPLVNRALEYVMGSYQLPLAGLTVFDMILFTCFITFPATVHYAQIVTTFKDKCDLPKFYRLPNPRTAQGFIYSLTQKFVERVKGDALSTLYPDGNRYHTVTNNRKLLGVLK